MLFRMIVASATNGACLFPLLLLFGVFAGFIQICQAILYCGFVDQRERVFYLQSDLLSDRKLQMERARCQ